MTGRSPLEAMAAIDAILPAACALASAGAGLVYRSALGATAPFFGADEELGDGHE